jgi:hypothetical protein
MLRDSVSRNKLGWQSTRPVEISPAGRSTCRNVHRDFDVLEEEPWLCSLRPLR